MGTLRFFVLFYSFFVLFAGDVFAGIKREPLGTFTVLSPATYTYLGDSIRYDFSVQINATSIKTRTRIVIQPEIYLLNDTKCDTLVLHPIVLEGKLYHNLRLRNGDIDRYDSLALQFTPETNLTHRMDGCFPADKYTKVLGTSIRASVTSCCERRDAPVVELPVVICNYGGDNVVLPPFDKEIRNKEEHISENIKWRRVSGHVYLLFKINEYKIDLTSGDNYNQIQAMTHAFRKVLTDPYARFDSAFVKGQASPDGNTEFNTKLAIRRSKDALRFLKEELDSLKLPYVPGQFTLSYLPEAWDELYQKIESNPNVPHKEKVLAIIRDTENIEMRKYLLKRMRDSFAFLRDSILGNIRRVDYDFYFTFKDVTPEEQQELLYRRPDVYTPADFLAVEKAAEGDKQKIDILLIAYEQYPDNTHILQNLLAEYIRQERWEDAGMLVDTIDGYKHSLLEVGFLRNYAIVCLHNENYGPLYSLSMRMLEESEEILTPELQRELHYNLGLLHLRQYRFQDAYLYLEPFKDVNTILALRGLGRMEEADTLEKEMIIDRVNNNEK